MPIQDLQHSDYRIRKLIGSLGLALPILLPIASNQFLASISHYYYSTLSSLLFIIILSAFGLFLISYKGYKKDIETETISDDFLTNIGGFAALIVVFIPTVCEESMSTYISLLCENENLPLFGHNNPTLGTIHLVSAGVFIFCMGWMSKYKFTRGRNTKFNTLYRRCGTIVFIAVALIIVGVILEKLHIDFFINNYYVFIFETVAVFAFGVSWLVKGKAIENIVAFKNEVVGTSENDNTENKEDS
ncbi:hypothetical protein [Winogradskyella schleiferi]|uniref:hypothetical protein n=1 Tax=Winogradskyella schleiferi TaxID=2686078 RepID=UPI0015BD0AB3|nr:hypothetical protein [Winogradskyella schleiferi]